MQFNSHADQQDIVSDISFLTGLDVNSYPLKDRARRSNIWLDIIWQLIFESYGGWKFMDDNVSDASTGIPYATQTVTADLGLYVLPSGSLRINGAELKTSSSGQFETLLPLTEDEFLARGGDAAFPSSGTPLFYLLQGDILRLLPTPNFTLASALRIFFDQRMNQFASTDTTATPGFASHLHGAVSNGASLDFCMSHPGMEAKAKALMGAWENFWKPNIKDHYSKRFRAKRQGISPAYDLVEDFK